MLFWTAKCTAPAKMLTATGAVSHATDRLGPDRWCVLMARVCPSPAVALKPNRPIPDTHSGPTGTPRTEGYPTGRTALRIDAKLGDPIPVARS
jgi:hypothetical protein